MDPIFVHVNLHFFLQSFVIFTLNTDVVDFILSVPLWALSFYWVPCLRRNSAINLPWAWLSYWVLKALNADSFVWIWVTLSLIGIGLHAHLAPLNIWLKHFGLRVSRCLLRSIASAIRTKSLASDHRLISFKDLDLSAVRELVDLDIGNYLTLFIIPLLRTGSFSPNHRRVRWTISRCGWALEIGRLIYNCSDSF